MISIFVLKTSLLRFGVVIQNVKFDIDNECIIVDYSMHGAQQRKIVPFSQIEQLFTYTPAAPADSDPDNVVGKGYQGPVD